MISAQDRLGMPRWPGGGGSTCLFSFSSSPESRPNSTLCLARQMAATSYSRIPSVARAWQVGELKAKAHKLTDEAAGEKVRLLQALHDGEQLRSRIVEVWHCEKMRCS